MNVHPVAETANNAMGNVLDMETLPSLSDLKNVYLKEEAADVHFNFPNEQPPARVPAHKLILANQSPVFMQMFFGPLKEGDQVKIVDSTSVVFKQFLRPFYDHELQITFENVIQIMYLVDKYNAVKCGNQCEREVCNQLNMDNVFVICELAMKYSWNMAIIAYNVFVAKAPRELFRSEPFLQCDRKIVEDLLTQKPLKYHILKAAMKWAEANFRQENIGTEPKDTDLRDQFADCWDGIPFATMKVKDFIRFEAKYPVFTFEEYKMVIREQGKVPVDQQDAIIVDDSD